MLTTVDDASFMITVNHWSSGSSAEAISYSGWITLAGLVFDWLD
jgi:hypothetical protein